MLSLRKIPPLVSMLASSLTGCAMSPGPEITRAEMCHLPRHRLAVELPGDQGPSLAAVETQTTLADEIRQAYNSVDLSPPIDGTGAVDETISPSMLFLSGGSQHGAFGAGYLNGWALARRGGLPRFRVVTGISTGAILSTFAFLDRTAVSVQEYSISSERQVLKPFVRHGSDIKLSDAVAVARHGALGDLAPLRQRMRQLIDDATLRALASEAEAGRRLFVGAVDVDAGQAVAIDMTALAKRYRTEADAQDMVSASRTANCYVEAVMASSTVPLAALPVFIDNRMYIDGGARFGVFSDEIGGLFGGDATAAGAQHFDASAPSSRPLPGPSIFVVINGTLRLQAQCGKSDNCTTSAAEGLDGMHAKWNLVGLASRSVSILINQTYRFSASRILAPRPAGDFQGRLARIEPDVDAFVFTIAGVERTCGGWEKEDKADLRPVEFHPRYMRCLIAYGAWRANASGWGGLS